MPRKRTFAARRILTAVTLAVCVVSCPGGPWNDMLWADESLTLEVREAGGFRRFRDPVSALIELPEMISRNTPFRLIIGGSPIAAQFRPDGDNERCNRWWID